MGIPMKTMILAALSLGIGATYAAVPFDPPGGGDV
jgi:hypothetical protein